MAGDFDIKINIKTVMEGEGGLEELLERLKALRQAVEEAQQAAGEGGLVTEGAAGGGEGAGAGAPQSRLGEAHARVLELVRETEAAITAIHEAGSRDRAETDPGLVSEEALEKAAEAVREAEDAMTEAAVEGGEARAEAAAREAEEIGGAYIEGLDGLDEKLKEISEDGSIEIFDLSGAFDKLKGAVAGVLGALTAYASFNGLKGLASSIISTGADFEQTMLQVKAVTGATDEQLERMSATAERLGAETEFSGKQAAQALNYLASAGLGVDQALGALSGTLDLASAGALDLGTAADIATSVLSGMGLEVEDLGRVNDVLVKTVNTSNTTLTELGEAFQKVGPIANSFKYDVETINALLGQLANAGLRGSTAGTSLSGALQGVAKAFEFYGVSAKRADGTAKDFLDALDLLRERGAGAAEVNEIFGQSALKSVLLLLENVKKDAGSVREAVRAVKEESEGSALAAAETMRQGFKVVMDELGGAIEGIGAASFKEFLEPLKEAVQGVTEAVTHAAPQFQKFTDTLMKGAVMGLQALEWVVKAGEWFQKSSVMTGLMTGAVILLATKMTAVLGKAILSFVVGLGRALVASASITAQIKAGAVTAEQAAAMQTALNNSYSAGMIPKAAYNSMTRQLTAVQARAALSSKSLAAALREEAVAASASAVSSGAVATASGAAAGGLAAEGVAAREAAAAVAAEGGAETGNAAATARGAAASQAAAGALRVEAGAARTTGAALTAEAGAASRAATANAAVATTSRAAAVGLAAQGTAARGAAAGLAAAGAAGAGAARGLGLWRGALMMLGGPAGMVVLGIAALVGVFSSLRASAREASREIADHSKALDEGVEKIGEYCAALVKLREEESKGKDVTEERAKIIREISESKVVSTDFVAGGAGNTEADALRELRKLRAEARGAQVDVVRDRIAGGGLFGEKNLKDRYKLVELSRQQFEEFRGGWNWFTALFQDAMEKREKEFQEPAKKLVADIMGWLNKQQNEYLKKIEEGLMTPAEAKREQDVDVRSMVTALGGIPVGLEEPLEKFLSSGIFDQLKAKAGETAMSAEQIAEALKFKLDPALKGIMDTAEELSGKSFFDAAALIQEAQNAGVELGKELEKWKADAKPRMDELNVILSDVNAPSLSEADRAKFTRELESYNAKLKKMEENLYDARVELAADAAGKIAELKAEEAKGTELTEKEKIAAYKAGAKASIEAEKGRVKASFDANTQVERSTISACDNIIAKYKELAAQGSLTARIMLIVARGVSAAAQSSFDKKSEDLNKTLNDLSALQAQIDGISSGKGGGGGGGSKKEKEAEDPSELMAAKAETARQRVEMAMEDMKDAVRQGSADVSGFVQDILKSALAANEMEVQAAVAAAQKMSSGTASEREKASAAMEKATRDGAKATEKAYEEAFKALEEAYDDFISRIQSKAETISVKVEMGMVSEAEGRKQLKALLAENQPSLDALVEGMKQLAVEAEAAGLKMDFAERIEAAQLEAVKLKSPLMEIANNINGVIRSSITGMLEDIAAGSITLGEALRQFLLNIAQGLAQIAAQQIASGIMGMLGSGGGGGIGGFLAGLFGAAEGGMVRGPGTGTSDSILARLSNGEYVIKADAVRFWGPEFLDQINRFRQFDARRLMGGYAEGGPVGDVAALRSTIIDNSSSLAKYVESPREGVQVDIGVKAEVDKDRLVKVVLDHPDFSKKVQKSNVREKRSLLSLMGN